MIQLDKQEQAVMQSLAESGQGSILIGLYKKMINEVVDVRNMTEINADEIKARKLFADKVEEYLINKIKVYSGQSVGDNDNEFN